MPLSVPSLSVIYLFHPIYQSKKGKIPVTTFAETFGFGSPTPDQNCRCTWAVKLKSTNNHTCGQP